MIRDAAVLMALNSALEPDGSINLLPVSSTDTRILLPSLLPTATTTGAAR